MRSSSLRCFSAGVRLPPSRFAPPATVFTIEELLGRMPVRDSLEARWVFSSLAAMGQTGVWEICTRLRQPGITATAQAEYALQGIASYVTRPGREADRVNFVSALGKSLGAAVACRECVLRHTSVSRWPGRAEAIPLLSRFLADEQLCEPAAQAMVAIRDRCAGPFLRCFPGVGRERPHHAESKALESSVLGKPSTCC